MDEDLMDEVGLCEYVDENSGVNLRFSHGEFFFWKKRVVACLLACLLEIHNKGCVTRWLCHLH